MKRTIQAIMVATLVLAAGVAAATDQATVTVTATVDPACRFSVNAATLAFGSLPFDAAGNPLGASATATLTFWCTNGVAYTITDDGGLHDVVPGVRRMQSGVLSPAEFIPYNLTYSPTAGTGSGSTNPVTLNLSGTVGTTYAANSPDNYSDTVTLTINP